MLFLPPVALIRLGFDERSAQIHFLLKTTLFFLYQLFFAESGRQSQVDAKREKEREREKERGKQRKRNKERGKQREINKERGKQRKRETRREENRET